MKKYLNFNSIKVRLKQMTLPIFFAKINDFNSIKVRLKLPPLQPLLNLATQFQFHKGTIKTSVEPSAKAED